MRECIMNVEWSHVMRVTILSTHVRIDSSIAYLHASHCYADNAKKNYSRVDWHSSTNDVFACVAIFISCGEVLQLLGWFWVKERRKQFFFYKTTKHKTFNIGEDSQLQI
ncbi:unnamed protein product [Orchesella dallaii]|uniref:Uncharacterized protein n=1 Tax=Orchesella dallaii TaxID=48710 RepID=A0ABP1QIE9_9HEXA